MSERGRLARFKIAICDLERKWELFLGVVVYIDRYLITFSISDL